MGGHLRSALWFQLQPCSCNQRKVTHRPFCTWLHHSGSMQPCTLLNSLWLQMPATARCNQLQKAELTEPLDQLKLLTVIERHGVALRVSSKQLSQTCHSTLLDWPLWVLTKGANPLPLCPRNTKVPGKNR